MLSQAQLSARSGSPHGTISSPRRETILLVEDDVHVRAAMMRMLSSCGYTALEASDGADALSIFRSSEGDIDLLLTDVVLPDMGGRRLADAMRCWRPELKVLYCSGYSDETIMRHGVCSSGASFLQKPVRLAILARKIREVLDQPQPSTRPV